MTSRVDTKTNLVFASPSFHGLVALAWRGSDVVESIMTTYSPTLEQVKAMAGQGNIVPEYREVVADLETPVSAYLKVVRGKHSFLLESVEGGERSRGTVSSARSRIACCAPARTPR